MARPAPSVDRTIKLLNFLASQPQDQFTLSDLARRLDFNKATCHAMLNELVEGGVLLRNPARKTYGLGPALVGWGVAAALDAYRALEFAEEEMTQLRQSLDVACIAVGRVGSDLVVLARRDVDRPLPAYIPVGHRIPAVPPFGTEFYAWAAVEEVEEWLGRLGLTPDDDGAKEYLQLLEEMRATGHRTSVSDRSDISDLLDALRSEEAAPQVRQHVDELIAVLQQRGWSKHGSTTVTNVVAPIFGVHGTPILALTLSSFAEEVTTAEAGRYIEPLMAAARRITSRLGGVSPFARPRRGRPKQVASEHGVA